MWYSAGSGLLDDTGIYESLFTSKTKVLVEIMDRYIASTKSAKIF